jgi:hypothetical protein
MLEAIVVREVVADSIGDREDGEPLKVSQLRPL